MLDLDYLSSIIMIIGIDLVLGGDNAIVIALASRNLPENKQNMAIIFGTMLAIISRIVLTIIAVYLLTIPFLNFVGGVLLIWIAIKLLIHDNDEATNIKASTTLWVAIRTIVLADIIMGLDNVIAIAGAAHGNVQLVVIGLLISVPIIIWGSKMVLYFMERWPILIYIGASILAYTAGNMIVHESRLQILFQQYPLFTNILPLIIIFIVIFGAEITNRLRLSSN